MVSSENIFTLVGLGEVLWDMLPDGKKLGGAPANFAYHAQELGGRGVIVSCIGDDELGKQIINQLQDLGLDCKYIAVDDTHPTGTVDVELGEKGKPNFTIHENVAWDFIPSNSNLLELAAKTDAVCFGSLGQRSEVSRKTVRRYLKATSPDCIRLFDINLRQSYFSKEIIDAMLQLSNVLKLNDDELPVVADLLALAGSQDHIFAQLSERYGLRLIALTKGAKGSRLYSQGEVSDHQGFTPEQIVDTVGAGDAFGAALALGLLQQKSLDKIAENANRVASFVCSRSGATPKLPDSLIQAL